MICLKCGINQIYIVHLFYGFLPPTVSVGFLLSVRFGTKLYRLIVGIPIGTNCAPPVADLFFILFLYCYERDFMDSLPGTSMTF